MPIFPLKKIKLVVSDFHLGKGRRLSDGTQNLLEDFRSDRQFIEFLDYFMTGPHKRCGVELILNGDFFNPVWNCVRVKHVEVSERPDSADHSETTSDFAVRNLIVSRLITI